jgi:hypothetical protein
MNNQNTNWQYAETEQDMEAFGQKLPTQEIEEQKIATRTHVHFELDDEESGSLD